MRNADSGESTKGYLLAVTAAVLWATLGVLGKFLYGYGADPLTVVTIRATVAFVTLAIALQWRIGACCT